MKQVLLFIFCLLVFGVSAQTLHVEAHENNLSSSDLWTEMVTEIKVENISQSNTVEVKVSKEILDAPANTTNYFCWVNCFLAQTMVSPTQITFAPGDVDDINFSVHFNPQGISGIAAIKYCAFDADNVADSACTIVHFNAVSTDIFEEENILSFSNFHPNPTSLNTEMNYNIFPGQQCRIVGFRYVGQYCKKTSTFWRKWQTVSECNRLKSGPVFLQISCLMESYMK